MFQLWPRELFQWLLYRSDPAQLCVEVSWALPILWHCKTFQDLVPVSILESAISPGNPGSFSLKIVLETKSWVLGMLVVVFLNFDSVSFVLISPWDLPSPVSITVIYPLIRLISLTISSESQVCPPYYWFLFSLALTLLSTTSNADFNSIIFYSVFFPVLCTSFSILSHSEPEVCFSSELSRSYVSLFLSILLLCFVGFVFPDLIFHLYTLNKFIEQVRFGSRKWGNKIVTMTDRNSYLQELIS